MIENDIEKMWSWEWAKIGKSFEINFQIISVRCFYITTLYRYYNTNILKCVNTSCALNQFIISDNSAIDNFLKLQINLRYNVIPNPMLLKSLNLVKITKY